MKRLNYRHMVLYLFVAILLFSAGWLARGRHGYYDTSGKSRRVALQGFRYTSPLLDVELPEGIVVGHEPIPFKYKIKSFVQKQIDSGQVRNISVYYRDLHDGPWFGINEKLSFNPASMMKVPIMIAWLKRAEMDHHQLNRMLKYDGTVEMGGLQDSPPEHRIAFGKSYSVEELLRYMIAYSDNNATTLLYSQLGVAEISNVIDGMDVADDPGKPDNSISLHAYSGFFRILYNAAYLSREMSEKALELLSYNDFPQGIAGGVPRGTIVASKFGEYGPESQLHEFGIVYHAKRPFILGIMTQGHDYTVQAEIIREISHMIYEEVDAGKSIAEAVGTKTP